MNVTSIPSSRVPLTDAKTGLVSREWYRYWENLFTLVGSGGNAITLADLQLAPPTVPFDIGSLPALLDTGADQTSALLSQVAVLDSQVQALAQTPPVLPVVGVDLGEAQYAEVQTSGTGGGNSVAAWTTRVLNTTTASSIAGASLAANQVTLPAGTYSVNASVPCYSPVTPTGFKARLYDATGAAVLLNGTTSQASTACEARCFITGRFTLTVASAVRIEMIATAVQVSGWGVDAAIPATDNHFTDIVFQRVN